MGKLKIKPRVRWSNLINKTRPWMSSQTVPRIHVTINMFMAAVRYVKWGKSLKVRTVSLTFPHLYMDCIYIKGCKKYGYLIKIALYCKHYKRFTRDALPQIWDKTGNKLNKSNFYWHIMVIYGLLLACSYIKLINPTFLIF